MENCSIQKIKEIPITTFISLLLIIIYFLYSSNIISHVPCDNNLASNIMSSFVHTDPTHLIYNLYAILALSRVETILGSKQFLYLIIFLTIMNSVFETLLKKIIPETPCSIGFSGVLFGILFWEIISNNGMDIFILSSVIPLVLIPSVMDKKSSFSSHFIGMVTGTISGYIYYKMTNGYIDKSKTPL